MTFDPKTKMPIGFDPKFENIEQMCIYALIVKLEPGGQQLPVIKKNLPGNSFNLKKSFF